jgi:predicted transcriptional regulator of viral defense system
MREAEVQRYVIENMEEVFPGMSIVGIEELLLERYRVDLHLINDKGIEVFIEIVTGGITERKAGQILNYYSILANMDPPLKKFRFIVLGEDINENARNILENFGVEVMLLKDLSIDEKKVRRHFRRKDLKNVLTAVESDILSHIKESKCSLVDSKKIKDYLNVEAGYASKILERLNQKGYLERIIRGNYLFIPLEYGYEERYPPMNSLVVGSVLTKPYYYGYQTANNYHGFTSQFSPKTYICTVKPRRNFRWRNTSYKFVKLVDDKFFGFTMVEADGCKICVAEPEKAVLDSLDKPNYCGGVSQVIYVVHNALSSDVDRDKLLLYADRMGSNSVLQRLGYIVELLSERGLINVGEDFLGSIMGLIPEGASYSYLGPVGAHGHKGPAEGRWRIIMNVDETTALSELEVK